jgi:hypothetical protein
MDKKNMNKLKYELVLKLKEAGFPQREDHHNRLGDIIGFSDTGVPIQAVRAYTPTLSELIEALGDENDFTLYIRNKIWRAVLIDRQKGITILGADGSTPEEAVALLWLELNNKYYG